MKKTLVVVGNEHMTAVDHDEKLPYAIILADLVNPGEILARCRTRNDANIAVRLMSNQLGIRFLAWEEWGPCN